MNHAQQAIKELIEQTEKSVIGQKFALSIAGGFFTIGVVAIIMVSRYAMMAV